MGDADPHDLVKQGRWQDAMRAFERAFDETGDPEDLVDAAIAAKDGGLFDDAIRLATRALQLDPDCASGYVWLGVIYLDLERWPDARVALEKALTYEVRPSLLSMLGVVYRRLGEHAEAEAVLRRAIAMEPGYDEAHHNLGSVLQRSRPLEAVEHYRRALAIDPDRPFTRREMAVALWMAGRLDDAIAACKLAIDADGADAWGHFFLGAMLREQGVLDLARDELGRAVELDPSIGMAWAGLAAVAATLGDHAGAEASYLQGLSNAPDSSGLRREYGAWLAGAGRTSEARQHLARALELSPADKKARAALAGLDRDADE
jgi:tetratricopeptide (TPR) repeat protein